MGAYNWITINESCPHCGQFATIRCQTHVASDYGGDQLGRFHDNEYQPGDRMRWYEESHKNFQEWRPESEINPPEPDSENLKECCYANCMNCNRELYAVIEFHFTTPSRVLGVGLEENWPDNFYK
jgi:hypothetical protein